MEDNKEEKRYKIERIEKGIKDAALYESVRTVMHVGLIAMTFGVLYVLKEDYNFDRANSTLESVTELILTGTLLLSIAKTFRGIVNLGRLRDLRSTVKDRKNKGEESLDFNELKFTEHSIYNMDDTNGPLKNVILNGFFKEENEDTSKRRQK